MGAFAKTVFWAAAVGFVAACGLLFSVPVPVGSGVGKVLPGLWLAAMAACFVVAWPVIASLSYHLARRRKQPLSLLRELRIARLASVGLFALAAAFVGNRYWSQHSFQARLRKIDEGAFSSAELKGMVDAVLARGESVVLGESFHVMSHMVSSQKTPPELLEYIVDQGDISSDFWAGILANPRTNPATKTKIALLKAEAQSRWGGIITDERLRSRKRASVMTPSTEPSAAASSGTPTQ